MKLCWILLLLPFFAHSQNCGGKSCDTLVKLNDGRKIGWTVKNESLGGQCPAGVSEKFYLYEIQGGASSKIGFIQRLSCEDDKLIISLYGRTLTEIISMDDLSINPMGTIDISGDHLDYGYQLFSVPISASQFKDYYVLLEDDSDDE